MITTKAEEKTTTKITAPNSRKFFSSLKEWKRKKIKVATTAIMDEVIKVSEFVCNFFIDRKVIRLTEKAKSKIAKLFFSH